MLAQTVQDAEAALQQAQTELGIDTGLLDDFCGYFKNKDEK